MSSERDYTRKFAGVMGLTITDLETSITRAMRLPTNGMIDDNADVEKITGTDSLGRETVIGTNVKGYKPVLTLTYSGANLDLVALQKGRKVITGTFSDLFLPKEMQITKNNYAGATTGKVGFAVTVDAPSQASILSDTLDYVPLHQQPFATFDPVTPISFAIGPNFARKFSNDLVASRRFVQIEVPYSGTARSISEETLGPQRVNMLVKLSNDSIALVKIPLAQIDPAGSKLDPKGENIEVKFDLSGLGVCEPYQVYEMVDKVFCDR